MMPFERSLLALMALVGLILIASGAYETLHRVYIERATTDGWYGEAGNYLSESAYIRDPRNGLCFLVVMPNTSRASVARIIELPGTKICPEE